MQSCRSIFTEQYVELHSTEREYSEHAALPVYWVAVHCAASARMVVVYQQLHNSSVALNWSPPLSRSSLVATPAELEGRSRNVVTNMRKSRKQINNNHAMAGSPTNWPWKVKKVSRLLNEGLKTYLALMPHTKMQTYFVSATTQNGYH